MTLSKINPTSRRVPPDAGGVYAASRDLESVLVNRVVFGHRTSSPQVRLPGRGVAPGVVLGPASRHTGGIPDGLVSSALVK